MFFDSASEEKSEKLAISKYARDDFDEFRNHRFVITLVEGINDDYHRRGKRCDRLHWFSNQCSELVVERSTNDIGSLCKTLSICGLVAGTDKARL